MKVGAVLREALVRLQGVSDTPQLDAALLTAHALGIDRSRLLASRDETVDERAALRLAELIALREAGMPVAYLLGSAGFYGREFSVTPEVLVPRPETEELVEAALAALRAHATGCRRVADIGTGSGAIAVTLAAECEDARVVATDLSEEALAVARRNAVRHGVAERITFARGDVSEALSPHAPFDVVVANLPYVPSTDVPRRPNPAGFEPRLALDGGPDGLAVYRRLLEGLGPLTAPGAALLFEAAPPTIASLAAAVSTAFTRAAVEIHRDYGGLERFVSAQLP